MELSLRLSTYNGFEAGKLICAAVGKSGAMRVGYLWLPKPARVYLLIIFPKNEKDNLSAAERKYFRQWIEYIRWEVEHEE